MASQPVIHQLPYAAVKQGRDLGIGPSYDVWTWNVYKLKWTRMSNHGCGFSSPADALIAATAVSNETAAMLQANKSPPTPLIGI